MDPNATGALPGEDLPGGLSASEQALIRAVRLGARRRISLEVKNGAISVLEIDESIGTAASGGDVHGFVHALLSEPAEQDIVIRKRRGGPGPALYRTLRYRFT